ncbi:MAG: sulfite exporter TauE/SafE family protein [Candidatus Lokiarchaeota archaeon]|nr:sulfite exporter TauE/SafE family protein [Candidatus Lokiarchaeota archaeon]
MRIRNEWKLLLFGALIVFSSCLTICSVYSTSGLKRNFVHSSIHSSTYLQENISLHYFFHPLCGICIDAHQEVLDFLNTHPEIQYIEYDISNSTQKEAAESYLNTEYLSWPSVVIEITPCKYYINGQFITSKNLENIYSYLIDNPLSCEEWMYYREYNIWIPLITGLLSGLSPCVILITGVFGTSLLANQSKKYFLFSLVGFSLGVLIMYFIIGFLFTYFMDVASMLLSGLTLKLVLGIPLILLGLWQCIDAWNENSRLFRTPEKLKKFFKNLSEENSMFSSFLLGSAFTILKSPCIGGILLSLLFSINQVGLYVPGRVMTALLLFSIGVLVPIITIFGILRIGISNEKISTFRVKARPYLRLISGLVIIITALLAII